MKNKIILSFLLLFLLIGKVNALNSYQIGDEVVLLDGTRWHVIKNTSEVETKITLLNDYGVSKTSDDTWGYYYTDAHLQDIYVYCEDNGDKQDKTREYWRDYQTDTYNSLQTKFLPIMKNKLGITSDSDTPTVRLLNADDLINLGCTIDSNDYNRPICNTYPEWFTTKSCYTEENELVNESQNFWIGIMRGDSSWHQHYAYRKIDKNGNVANKIVSMADDWKNVIRVVVEVDKKFIAPTISFEGVDNQYKKLVLLNHSIDDVITTDRVYDVDNNFDYTSQYYTPSKEGSVFDGWYTDSNYSTKVTSATTFVGQETVYAKFIDESEVVEPEEPPVEEPDIPEPEEPEEKEDDKNIIETIIQVGNTASGISIICIIIGSLLFSTGLLILLYNISKKGYLDKISFKSNKH